MRSIPILANAREKETTVNMHLNLTKNDGLAKGVTRMEMRDLRTYSDRPISSRDRAVLARLRAGGCSNRRTPAT